MAARTIMEESCFDVDKLTSDIFSLLENEFLFGSSDKDSSRFLPPQKSQILDESIFSKLKSNPNATGKLRVLSIDGSGSTDGILAAKSLAYLEASLCQKTGNPDTRIADFFDVAAGSGIGGILVALLFTKGEDNRPIFKAEEALQFLITNGPRLASKKGVFNHIFGSSSKAKKLFRRTFGECTLKDTVKPVLIPCYDLTTRAAFLFSRADAFETNSYDFMMSDVCAATSAHPTLAGAFKLSSLDKRTKVVAIDGCVAMNNPTAAAITHVLNNKQEFPFCDSVEDVLVMSLGNGVSSSNSSCQQLTLSPANLVKLGGEGASDMVDEAVSMAFGDSVTSSYVRIQANGPATTKTSNSRGNGKTVLDDVEEMLEQKNVESVLFRGKKVAEKTNSNKLELFAGELIKEHERRKSSFLPTVVFKQSSPRTSSATVSTISSN